MTLAAASDHKPLPFGALLQQSFSSESNFSRFQSKKALPSYQFRVKKGNQNCWCGCSRRSSRGKEAHRRSPNWNENLLTSTIPPELQSLRITLTLPSLAKNPEDGTQAAAPLYQFVARSTRNPSNGHCFLSPPFLVCAVSVRLLLSRSSLLLFCASVLCGFSSFWFVSASVLPFWFAQCGFSLVLKYLFSNTSEWSCFCNYPWRFDNFKPSFVLAENIVIFWPFLPLASGCVLGAEKAWLESPCLFLFSPPALFSAWFPVVLFCFFLFFWWRLSFVLVCCCCSQVDSVFQATSWLTLASELSLITNGAIASRTSKFKKWNPHTNRCIFNNRDQAVEGIGDALGLFLTKAKKRFGNQVFGHQKDCTNKRHSIFDGEYIPSYQSIGITLLLAVMDLFYASFVSSCRFRALLLVQIRIPVWIKSRTTPTTKTTNTNLVHQQRCENQGQFQQQQQQQRYNNKTKPELGHGWVWLYLYYCNVSISLVLFQKKMKQQKDVFSSSFDSVSTSMEKMCGL